MTSGVNAFERSPKTLVGSKPFCSAPSSVVVIGRRFGGSSNRACAPGSTCTTIGREPLPWMTMSGRPSPSKSATACDATMPSATTGKSLRLAIVIGQLGR